jgi:multidrug efflux pump subunit AcrA (membrane-fusion protein)
LDSSLFQTGNQAPGAHRAPAVKGPEPGIAAEPPPLSSGQARQHISWPQRAGAALIAGACIFAAAWYVPGIFAADGRSLTGAVTSNGIIYLNFPGSGQLVAITVHPGQLVRKKQLLATEADPAAEAVIAADQAAITADKAQLGTALATGAAAGIASARALLAKDEALLAIDRAEVVAQTQIVAPSAGTVVAVNGQPGETADADGIRDYSSQPLGTPITQQPLFSLFPEGPQASVEAGGSTGAASLPVVALRTSSAWQVTCLVPQSSVAAVKPGQVVTIDVPAAGITGIPGRVQELLTMPVATSQGMAYQAVVTVLGHQQFPPPSGMVADVQLGS